MYMYAWVEESVHSMTDDHWSCVDICFLSLQLSVTAVRNHCATGILLLGHFWMFLMHIFCWSRKSPWHYFFYHVTCLRNFRILIYIFILLTYYTAQQNLTLLCFRKSSVASCRSWCDEFSGTVRIIASFKVSIEIRSKKDLKQCPLSLLLHFMSLYKAKYLKAMNKNDYGFYYLRQMFQSIIDAKIKEDISVVYRPHTSSMTSIWKLCWWDLIKWKVFKDIMENILGN